MAGRKYSTDNNKKGNMTRKNVRDMSTLEKVGEVAGAFAKDLAGPAVESAKYLYDRYQGTSHDEAQRKLRK
jgi:hypothetical protein